MVLYVYLMARHNDAYGYAFPTTVDIASTIGCGINQVARYKRVLRGYGLIETKRHPTHGNDIYFVKAPITDEAVFYDKFPAAKAHHERRQALLTPRRERSAAAKPVDREAAKMIDWL
ncbi:helix-turn-helix domain-containing protein [Mycobacterium gordonae]|nr:helix-turn-helix domain-containing protein [Mycobacterium gordonae]